MFASGHRRPGMSAVVLYLIGVGSGAADINAGMAALMPGFLVAG
jgi:hypothetical protein